MALHSASSARFALPHHRLPRDNSDLILIPAFRPAVRERPAGWRGSLQPRRGLVAPGLRRGPATQIVLPPSTRSQASSNFNTGDPSPQSSISFSDWRTGKFSTPGKPNTTPSTPTPNPTTITAPSSTASASPTQRRSRSPLARTAPGPAASATPYTSAPPSATSATTSASPARARPSVAPKAQANSFSGSTESTSFSEWRAAGKQDLGTPAAFLPTPPLVLGANRGYPTPPRSRKSKSPKSRAAAALSSGAELSFGDWRSGKFPSKSPKKVKPQTATSAPLGASAALKPQTPAKLSTPRSNSASASTSTLVSVSASASAATLDSGLSFSVGKAEPLGPSPVKDGAGKATGVNFALFSQHGTSVTLCLFLQGQIEGAPDKEYVLDASKGHRTGDVWHVAVQGIPLIGVNYAYRVDGPRGWDKGNRFDANQLLIDPYAPLLDGRRTFGDASMKMSPFRGTFDFDSPPFDWEGDENRKRIREEDVVIYEMNVRAFTADPSSGLDAPLRGSYKGLAEKVQHLVDLGVNSVELLPIHEFDEFEFQRQENPRNHMLNTWGYSTVNFFAPMLRYGSGGKGPAEASKELKEMIKTLHKNGIEVILDVVYNHTNEGDDAFPYTTSFKGIDCSVYYILDLTQYVQLTNYSGCGNTFNCNHPVVMQLILDSLRHWVTEYHVDGFRFDLASILCRGSKGEPLQSPPLIRACAKDEILSKVRLISEPWDCGGLYLVGRFPNWDKWAEWNGKYRDDIRSFIKGDMGMKGAFATRLAGSADLYNVNNRKPWASVNFVIAHDGFTLYDLVAYNSKHNEANGEQGRDGCNDNFSWNCGAEGPTGDATVNALRSRQIKNFHLALMISQGVPMMLMGDEYGHTRGGNNNSYGHDNALNNFQWQQLEKAKPAQFRYFSAINNLRALHPVLRQPNFLSPNDLKWHEDNWGNPDSRFLAFTLVDHITGKNQHLYTAFNAHTYFVECGLPPPPSGKEWVRLVDTNLPSPEDVVEVETGSQGLVPKVKIPIKGVYNIAPFSSLVLLAV